MQPSLPPADRLRPRATTVGRAALLMSGMIFASRVTGLVRQAVIAHLFGVSWRTDAYSAAFSLPDFIYFLISGGALATGFVPVFTEFVTKHQPEQARRTFRALATFLSVTLLVVIGLCWVMAPQLVWLISPGFRTQPETLELTVQLTRILLPAQFFFVLGGLFQGTLNSLKYFFVTAWQPIIYNLGIIVGAVTAHQLGGPTQVEGLVVGALVGAFLGAFVVQVPALLWLGMSFRPLWDLRDPGVRKVGTLVLPVIFGLSIQQVNAIILPRTIATTLGEGAAIVIEYSNRLMQVPVAIFASGMAIALLPTLSALVAAGKRDAMREQLARSLRLELLLAVPSAVLLFVLAGPIVRLFYEHGAFGPDDTARVAYALGFYCPGILGMSAQQIVSRGFYALQDTASVVVLGLVGCVSYFVAAYVFLNLIPLGLGAPAAATSVSALVNASLLIGALGRKVGAIEDSSAVATLLKSALAAALAGLLAHAVVTMIEQRLDTASRVVQLGQVASALTLAAVAYAALLRALRVDEAAFVIEKLLKKLGLSRSAP